jgi:hypothetical protein
MYIKKLSSASYLVELLTQEAPPLTFQQNGQNRTRKAPWIL